MVAPLAPLKNVGRALQSYLFRTQRLEERQAGVRRVSAGVIAGWLTPETVAQYQGDSVVITLGEQVLGRIAIPAPSRIKPDEPWIFRLATESAVNANDFPRVGFRIGETGPVFSDSPAHAPRMRPRKVDFSDIASDAVDPEAPLLDQPSIDEEGLSEVQRSWRRDGAVILPGLFSDDLIEAYKQERWSRLPDLAPWSCPVVYMHLESCKALCVDKGLAQVLEDLMGEPMAVNLTLTGWTSTERNWHQDCYLNPSFLKDWYAAVWIALEDITPESGPFEYVPGSHRWPALTRDKVLAALEPCERNRADWPSTSERFVVPACEAEIERRGAEIRQFLPKKGDVLIWHGRLLHRGSRPKVAGTPRRALIAHYSGVKRRPDFAPAEQVEDKGWFFPVNMPLL